MRASKYYLDNMVLLFQMTTPPTNNESSDSLKTFFYITTYFKGSRFVYIVLKTTYFMTQLPSTQTCALK